MSLCSDSQELTFNGTRDTEVLPDQLIVSQEIGLRNLTLPNTIEVTLTQDSVYTITLPLDANLSRPIEYGGGLATFTMFFYKVGTPPEIIGSYNESYFAADFYVTEDLDINTKNLVLGGVGGDISWWGVGDIGTIYFSPLSIGPGTDYNQIVTITGEAAVGEVLSVNITRYCIDNSSLYPVSAFDTRVDTEFTFSPSSDGSYRVEYEGAISGVLEVDNVLVKIKSNKDIGHVACRDTKKISCNECVTDEYMHKKALSAMADSLFNCERFCQAETKLAEITSFNNCGKKVSNCGCN